MAEGPPANPTLGSARTGRAATSGWTPRTADWSGQAASAFAGKRARPLFIGACARSGTTLLRGLLDNHPGLAVPAETDFVIPVWLRRKDYGDLRKVANRRRLADWIFTTPGHGGKRIRAGTPLEEAIERVAASPPTLGSVLASCFQLYAVARGKPRWGDKRPGYANRMRMLFQLFPDAQFINLVRDPRAVVSSLIRIGFFPGDDALEAGTAMWEASIRNVDGFSRRLRPDQLLDIRYEDMVRDPAAMLRQVCDFAALPAGPAIDEMLSGERGGRFRPGWHDRLGEPISAAQVDAWRERLRPSDVALIEHALQPELERFGYERSGDAASAPDRAQLRELARQRRRRARRWRRHMLGEYKRALVYRQSVAAVGSAGESGAGSAAAD